MDIDDAVLEFLGEGFAQNLHVAGENDRVGAGLGDDFAEAVLGDALVGVARHVVERHAEGPAYGAQVGVVTHDTTKFAGEVAVAVLQEQIVQAVVRLGYKNCDALRLGGVKEFPVEFQARGQRFQVLVNFLDVCRIHIENGTQEEGLDIFCGMLLEVDDVCASLGKDLRGAGDKPLLVGTVDLQYVTGYSHM